MYHDIDLDPDLTAEEANRVYDTVSETITADSIGVSAAPGQLVVGALVDCLAGCIGASLGITPTEDLPGQASGAAPTTLDGALRSSLDVLDATVVEPDQRAALDGLRMIVEGGSAVANKDYAALALVASKAVAKTALDRLDRAPAKGAGSEDALARIRAGNLALDARTPPDLDAYLREAATSSDRSGG